MSSVAKLLLNKHIAISGGAGSLGTPIIKSFINNGAKVSCFDIISKADALKQINFDDSNDYINNFNYIQCNTSNEDDIESFIYESNKIFGPIDTSCIHTGIVNVTPILNEDINILKNTFNTNVFGSFIFAQKSAQHMLDYKTKGHLLFTSSWVGESNWPGLVGYGASKAALNSMMRSFALELAQYNIRSNCIAPGIVGSGMALKAYNSDLAYKECVDQSLPLKELQTVDSVADMFVFVCSDKCNYMTGNIVTVDGGCHLINKHTVKIYYDNL